MNIGQFSSITKQSHNNNNSILGYMEYPNNSNKNNNDITWDYAHTKATKTYLQNISNTNTDNKININEKKNNYSIISFSKIIEYKHKTKIKLKTAEIIKEINDYILIVPNKNIYKFKHTDDKQAKLGKKDEYEDWILNFEKHDKDNVVIFCTKNKIYSINLKDGKEIELLKQLEDKNLNFFLK